MCNGTQFAVEKISPRAGIELGKARSVGQNLTHWATGAPCLPYLRFVCSFSLFTFSFFLFLGDGFVLNGIFSKSRKIQNNKFSRTVKKIRIFYSKIPGNQLPVHFPLFLRASACRTFLEIKIW